MCNFFPPRIRKAHIQHGAIVLLRDFYRSIDLLEHILPHQTPIPKHPYGSAVSLKQRPVLTHLGESRLGHVHQAVDFVFAPLEVLDAEGVDGDVFHAAFVTHLQHPRERFKAHVVPFDGLDLVTASPASVAVHDEGDVLGDGAAFEGADEELAHALDEVFDGGQGEDPAAEGDALGGVHAGGSDERVGVRRKGRN